MQVEHNIQKMESDATISREEVVMVLLQYLKENHLIRTMISLESETGFKLMQYGKDTFSGREISQNINQNRNNPFVQQYRKEISFLRDLIIDAQWEDAENFLKPLKARQMFNFDRAIYEIRRQQFVEDIVNCHLDELDIVGLLARAKDLQDKCTADEFNALCSYLTYPNIKDHPDFKNWSIEKGRIDCFEHILELLKTVYSVESHSESMQEGRLISLIRYSLQLENMARDPNKKVNLLQDFYTPEGFRKLKDMTITVEKQKKVPVKEEATDVPNFGSLSPQKSATMKVMKRPTTAKPDFINPEPHLPQAVHPESKEEKKQTKAMESPKAATEIDPGGIVAKQDPKPSIPPTTPPDTEKIASSYEAVEEDKAYSASKMRFKITKMTQTAKLLFIVYNQQ